MKKIGILFIFIYLFGGLIVGQEYNTVRYDSMESLLFDETTEKLKQSVFDASRKQAIYAYNVANFSTPGFNPIMLEEDRRFFDAVIPQDRDNSDVMLEHFMAQMPVNRAKHSALTKLFSTKLGIMRQVATLGKK